MEQPGVLCVLDGWEKGSKHRVIGTTDHDLSQGRFAIDIIAPLVGEALLSRWKPRIRSKGQVRVGWRTRSLVMERKSGSAVALEVCGQRGRKLQDALRFLQGTVSAAYTYHASRQARDGDQAALIGQVLVGVVRSEFSPLLASSGFSVTGVDTIACLMFCGNGCFRKT